MNLTDVDALKKKFEENDTDGSGAIDHIELKAALVRAGKLSVTSAQIKYVMDKFCVDKHSPFYKPDEKLCAPTPRRARRQTRPAATARARATRRLAS